MRVRAHATGHWVGGVRGDSGKQGGDARGGLCVVHSGGGSGTLIMKVSSSLAMSFSSFSMRTALVSFRARTAWAGRVRV